MWDWRWMLVGFLLGSLIGWPVAHWGVLPWLERRRWRRLREQVKTFNREWEKNRWKIERELEQRIEQDIAEFRDRAAERERIRRGSHE